jgi:hypothetical protein
VENEINSFREILPCLDSRRAVLNVAGSFFKLLFGTATTADLESLHNTVQELHEREENIVHSVNNQLTYLKTLDSSVQFNTKAVKILSGKVKAVM